MALGYNAPEMPTEGHKAHRNNLSVRAEDWRKLKEMVVLSSQGLDADALECTSRCLSVLVNCIELAFVKSCSHTFPRTTWV